MKYLPYSKHCFVCGDDNPAGLRIRFFVENDVVKARWNARACHCGYPNVAHGGVIAALLDETMGWAAARAIERMCVTADLSVRYLLPTPAQRDLTVITEVVSAKRRLAKIAGSLVDDEGAVYARAEGRFIPISIEETLRVDDNLIYRGDEERVFDRLRAAQQ